MDITDAFEFGAKGAAIMSYNKVMLLGNLGQDPEIRYTPRGLPVVNFTVATHESEMDKDGKNREQTEWHRVVVAGKLALTCSQYLKKGRLVFVEGRLRTRKSDSESENGGGRRYTKIVSNRVQFLDLLSREVPNNAGKPNCGV
jgi:single-strand DNA-binding protein